MVLKFAPSAKINLEKYGSVMCEVWIFAVLFIYAAEMMSAYQMILTNWKNSCHEWFRIVIFDPDFLYK